MFKNSGLKPDGLLCAGDENVKTTTEQVSQPDGAGCNPKGGQGFYCTKVLSEGAMNY